MREKLKILYLIYLIVATIFILTLLSDVVFSAPIALSGVGCDKNPQKALQFALDDLSSQIYVHVSSELIISQTASAERVKHNITLTSALPIFSYTQSASGECVTVAFNEKTALNEYMNAIDNAVRDIDTGVNMALADNVGQTAQKTLQTALARYDEYIKLSMVARAIGAANILSPDNSYIEVQNMLARYQSVAMDIDTLADMIREQINTKIYNVGLVSLAQEPGAVPPFGALLAGLLKRGSVTTAGAPILSCVYSPTGNPFIVNCALEDTKGDTKEAFAIAVDKKICEKTECFNPVISFQNILRSTPGKLKIHFYSNFGKAPVTLSNGDILTLYARVNKPTKLILINKRADGASVIPMGDNIINHVTPNEINREITLLKVAVTPPFGEEQLTLMACDNSIDEIKKLCTNESCAIPGCVESNLMFNTME